MDNEHRFLSLVKIWIVVTTALALSGMSVDVFFRLWLWFGVASMVLTALVLVVAYVIYPFHSHQEEPRDRPYHD